MTRAWCARSKIVGRGDQTFSKEMRPDDIANNACSKRILFRNNPLGEIEAIGILYFEAMGKRWRIALHCTEILLWLEKIATMKNIGRAWICAALLDHAGIDPISLFCLGQLFSECGSRRINLSKIVFLQLVYLIWFKLMNLIWHRALRSAN